MSVKEEINSLVKQAAYGWRRVTEVRPEGAAPRDRVPMSQIRPNTFVRRGAGGSYFEQGGIPVINPDGSPVRPGTASDRMAQRWAPKVYDTRAGTLQGRRASVAPRPKFDFRTEANKAMRSFVSEYRNNPGAYMENGRDLAGDMLGRFRSQWADMKANPNRYSEQQQRRILNQWQNQVAMMRGRRQSQMAMQSRGRRPMA